MSDHDDLYSADPPSIHEHHNPTPFVPTTTYRYPCDRCMGWHEAETLDAARRDAADCDG